MNKRRIISALAAVSVLFASTLLSLSVSAAGAEPDDDISATLDALTVNGYDSLSLGDEWLVLAAHAYDESLSFAAYTEDALANSDSVTVPVERQRVALALTAIGNGDCDFVRQTPDATIGEGGVMSYVFGLHLANNGVTGSRSSDDIISELIGLRLSDGGWAVRGTVSDVDVTAMAITALAPHYADSAVSDAVETALALLSSRQNERGGFSSFGVENAESSAQVVIALCALGRDPDSDPAFTKNGLTVPDALAAYRLADGTYSHTPKDTMNKTATLQALTALIAHKRLLSGNTPFYIFTDTNTAPAEDGTFTDTTAFDRNTENPSTADETAVNASASGVTVSYKPVVIAVIVTAAVAVIAVMFVRRRRDARDYLIVILIAALAAAVVIAVDIKTPNDYFAETNKSSDVIGAVTFSVNCNVIAGSASHIPNDGILIAPYEIGITDGDTVYAVTVEASRRCGVLLDFDASGTYLRGIGGISERDFGDLSGWMYRVNGEFPSIDCTEYTLSAGDTVEWIYTLDLGADAGG